MIGMPPPGNTDSVSPFPQHAMAVGPTSAGGCGQPHIGHHSYFAGYHPTTLGTTPTVPATTPTVPGTTPTVPGTTPTVPGTTPTVPGTTPTTLGSAVSQCQGPPVLLQLQWEGWGAVLRVCQPQASPTPRLAGTGS